MHIKRANFEKELRKIEDITAMSHIELGEDPSDAGEISLPMSTVRNILNRIPGADVVERKHGKWLTLPNGNCQCSECAKEKQFAWVNFRGSCGADMREEFKQL